MSLKYRGFPSQKKTTAQRTKEWYKECIDSFDNSGYILDEGVRSSYRDKLINYKLYNGIIDKEDIKRFVNPYDIKDDVVPSDIEHYPIAVPRIDLLLGEEIKRRFDFQAIVTNPDSISKKQNEKRKFIQERVTQIINSDATEQQTKEQVRQLEHELLYTFKDFREVRANKILKHYWYEQRFDRTFNEGFKDALLAGEEYYVTDIVAGEPVLNRIHPNNIFWLRSGFSNKVEDADVIYIDEYWSPGKIVDYFYDDLTAEQIKQLERGYNNSNGGDPFVDTSEQYSLLLFRDLSDDLSNSPLVTNSTVNRLLPYDQNGNIRVLRCFWRSWRRVKKIGYFDEFGEMQYDIMPDTYIADKSLGETEKILWVNEWLEGTRIAKDIYIRMRPRPIQYQKLDNPSYCHPGIVGSAYSTNSFSTVSLMQRTKPYQYMYNIYHDRLNKAVAKSQGKILNLDLAMVPGGWDVKQWLHYLKTMNIAITDSFKEGNKGQALGKMAGNMARGGHSNIDLQQSQYIQEHIALLAFIKQEMTEIIGVSDQRLGQIDTRETVGGVERSVNQSSHITEWYFHVHDDIKIRALSLFLETAKHAFKGKKTKMQNILDDGSIEMFDIDGDEFIESDYGIVITSSNKANEFTNSIKELAKVAFQSDRISLNTLAYILASDSTAEQRRKLEHEEQVRRQSQERQMEADQQNQQMALEAQKEIETAKMSLEESMNIRDNQTKILIANSDGSGEDTREKNLQDLQKFYDQLEEQKRQFNEKMKREDKKIAIAKTKKTTK